MRKVILLLAVTLFSGTLTGCGDDELLLQPELMNNNSVGIYSQHTGRLNDARFA